MSEWIEWAGGECPVAQGTVVQVELRGGAGLGDRPAGHLDWRHYVEKIQSEIVAYRIVRESAAPTSADDVQIAGDHYTTMTVQPWTAMEAWMTPEQFIGFLRGNVVKYAARAGSKGDALADYRKARHYLDKLIETLEAA